MISKRIDSFDGLRALAILLVIGFHFYSWELNLFNPPYNSIFKDWNIFKYGYFGVQLFFVLSGFVIVKSIADKNNLKNFIYARFLRLFPTMVLCCILIFLFSILINQSKAFYDFIPSITFLDPKIYNAIFPGHNFKYMDGPHWSLFVEIRFYLLISFLYFFNKNIFFINLTIITISVAILNCAAFYFHFSYLTRLLSQLFISRHLGYFIFGISLYYLYINNFYKFIILLTCSIINVYTYIFINFYEPDYILFEPVATAIVTPLIFILVYSSLKIKFISKLLSCKLLVIIGSCSYTLYLIHNFIGTNIIKIIGNPLNFLPGFSIFYSFIVILFLLIISIYLDKFIRYTIRH
ncbi:hypothetical protein A8O14_06135 [Polynucleobacter wuianus]|uniref:Acyltransferase 3 domain-containing protein n=1 Tax=Polynucleobacter wuianus TaxID=1743168 RepID=A0A191UFK4_9BURK|nr:hypothetical protein A8O14_06135 [Polynucleobacter wuianus]MBU3553907.1 acyltransferase [Polynucleobacter sp. MWH-Post4-6-1]